MDINQGLSCIRTTDPHVALSGIMYHSEPQGSPVQKGKHSSSQPLSLPRAMEILWLRGVLGR